MNRVRVAGAAAPGVAVLCAPADAAVLGGAAGLALSAGVWGAAAIVGVWTGREPSYPLWRAPALPAAQRLSARLVARGFRARASARLALTWLPGPIEAAVDAAGRIAAAGGSAPVVTVVGGPRAGAFEELLEAQDIVVVGVRSAADPGLAARAVQRLGERDIRASVCEVPVGVVPRALAGAGVALAPAAWSSLTAALGDLRA